MKFLFSYIEMSIWQRDLIKERKSYKATDIFDGKVYMYMKYTLSLSLSLCCASASEHNQQSVCM